MPDDFWPSLTGLPKSNSSTGSRIPHPVIRYIQRLLAGTLFCQGEVGKLTDLQLKCICTMLGRSDSSPPWHKIFIQHLLKQANSKSGKLTMGGMITAIADSLNIPPPVDEEGDQMEPLEGDVTFTIDAMIRACMLNIDIERKRYYWLWGPQNVGFMVLPSPRASHIPHPCSAEEL